MKTQRPESVSAHNCRKEVTIVELAFAARRGPRLCLGCQTHARNSMPTMEACPAAIMPFWSCWASAFRRFEDVKDGHKPTWQCIWT